MTVEPRRQESWRAPASALPRNVTYSRAAGEPWNGVERVLVDGKPVDHVRPHADGWEALTLDRQPLATFPTIDEAVMHVVPTSSHKEGDGVDIQGSFLGRPKGSGSNWTRAGESPWTRDELEAKIKTVSQDSSLPNKTKVKQLQALVLELKRLPAAPDPIDWSLPTTDGTRTADQAARDLGVDTETVQAQLMKQRREALQAPEPRTIQQVSKELGVDEETVRAWMAQNAANNQADRITLADYLLLGPMGLVAPSRPKFAPSLRKSERQARDGASAR
jgi:hypothetical protein